MYFHVFNHAVSGQQLFLDDQNYSYLEKQSDLYAKKHGVRIVAYCFMPTHYHYLLLAESRAQGSKFIQLVFNSYSQAFNRLYNRRGTLFESRAKFKLIETDEYALQLVRYIHLNPVEAGLVSKPEDWNHSNYREILASTDANHLVWSYFGDPAQYREFGNSSLAKGELQT